MPEVAPVQPDPAFVSVHGPETALVVNVPFMLTMPGVPLIVSCTVSAVNPLNTALTVNTPVCVAFDAALKHELVVVVTLRFEPVMGDVVVGLATCWLSVVVNTYAALLLASKSVTDQFPVTVVGAAEEELVPHEASIISEASMAMIANCLRMTDTFIVLPCGLG